MQHLGLLGQPGPLRIVALVGLASSLGWRLLRRTHARAVTTTVAVALFAGILLAGTVSAARAQSRPVDTAPRFWVTSNGTMQRIAAVDPELAEKVFTAPRAVALDGWGHAVTGETWASFRVFAAELRAGLIPRNVHAVMYDPEKWDSTPLREQRDPVTYMRRFEDLAHEHGYLAIVTPHPGLVLVNGAKCGARPGESELSAYLRCRIAAKAARHADVLETQAQALELFPSLYRAFVAATAAQARAANPDVIMLSGLSTHPAGYRVSAQMLLAAWDSVSGIVDGHYICLAGDPTEAAHTAVAFLRMVTPLAG